jgi:hypothetical protein
MRTELKKHAHKILVFCLTAIFCFGCSEEDLNNVLGGGDKNVLGLKEALKVGVKLGTQTLGMENGFLDDPTVFIDLPAENKATIETATKVIGAINDIPGVKSLLQSANINVSIFDADFAANLVNAFNRGASKAVADPRTLDIFVSAITNMTITDGMDILFSENNTAATDYLERNTSASLATQFSPIINETIQEINITIGDDSYSALDAWDVYAEQNNKLVAFVHSSEVQTALNLAAFILPDEVSDINSIAPADPDLGSHVVSKALDGVFTKIGDEEINIRENISARAGNKLLQDVFGQLDK